MGYTVYFFQPKKMARRIAEDVCRKVKTLEKYKALVEAEEPLCFLFGNACFHVARLYGKIVRHEMQESELEKELEKLLQNYLRICWKIEEEGEIPAEITSKFRQLFNLIYDENKTFLKELKANAKKIYDALISEDTQYWYVV